VKGVKGKNPTFYFPSNKTTPTKEHRLFEKDNRLFKKDGGVYKKCLGVLKKRRGVLKKRLGIGNYFPLWRFALFLRISAFIFAAPEP